MKLTALIFSVILFSAIHAKSQAQSQNRDNPYVKLGQKALIDGDFKEAVFNLEKSFPEESNNANVLYMLAYSYYHSGEYLKSIASFGQVISLRPGEVSAYYYRGKARNLWAVQANSLLTCIEREKLFQAAIKDFTKAIELNSEDIKLYQNRAIAYRDYGILKGQRIPKFYDKVAAETAFKSCIVDLQYVLELNPLRKDISDEMKKTKVYIANLNNK